MEEIQINGISVNVFFLIFYGSELWYIVKYCTVPVVLREEFKAYFNQLREEG